MAHASNLLSQLAHWLTIPVSLLPWTGTAYAAASLREYFPVVDSAMLQQGWGQHQPPLNSCTLSWLSKQPISSCSKWSRKVPKSSPLWDSGLGILLSWTSRVDVLTLHLIWISGWHWRKVQQNFLFPRSQCLLWSGHTLKSFSCRGS